MDCIRKLRDKCRTTHIPAEVDDGLETLDEYRSRWRSCRVIYFTMFLMSLGFSIILSGVWPYLNKLDPTAGKEFMGLIVAANPLAQMIVSPLFGWWSNKLGSIRVPLLSSLGLFAVASGIYASLELRPDNVKYWMLGSRFLIGVSSANIAVCRSYLSAATRLSERTKAVAMISLAQVLGFIIGPGLQAAVTPLGSEGYTLLGGAFIFNMFTACGWINVLMSVGNFVTFLPAFFEERRVAAREIMIMQGKTSERETWKAIKPDYVSAWTLIVAFFVLLFNFMLLETLGTPIIMDQFALSNADALYYIGILMSAGAVASFLTFLVLSPLCKLFPEEHVLIWGGFSLMVVGRLLYIPWGDSPPKLAEPYNATVAPDIDDERYLGCPTEQTWCATTPAITLSQFIIGYALTAVGYTIGVTLIQTIFSKVLGPRPQGVWMGLMVGAGCFARVLGPLFVGTIYTRLGTYWTFGTTGAMMLICMVWLLISRKRLIPPKYEKAVEMKTLNQDVEDPQDDIRVEEKPLKASIAQQEVDDFEMEAETRDLVGAPNKPVKIVVTQAT